MRSEIRILIVVVTLLALPIPLAVVAHGQASRVPDGVIEVAYRQLENGKLSAAVFQNWLECSMGGCTLSTLTIGQCIAGAWYPKLERWSTQAGTLKVVRPAERTIAIEFSSNGATFQMRFQHQSSVFLSGEVSGFSGAVVKQSDVLNDVLSWKLVPVAAKDSVFTPACPVSVAGVR